MATHFPVLPEELLEHIISLFESHEFRDHTLYGNHHINRRTLLSLARVNKQFHRLAQPLLYRSIASMRGLNSPWALQLLRTLLKQPKVADLVQDIWIETDMFDREEEPTAGAEFAELLPAATKRIEEEFSNHDNIRLLASLRNGNIGSEACIALLILIARNITFLHLLIPYEWEDTFLAEIIKESLPHPSDEADERKPVILQSVKTLMVEHSDSEDSTDLERLSDLIQILHSLEILRGHMLSVVEQDLTTSTIWPCNLKTIELTYSIVDAPGLFKLLHNCPNLQHLFIEWGDALVGDCEIDLPRIGDALRQNVCAKSLKTLKLDVSQAFGFEELEPIGLGDLKPLARLEKLAVNWICLAGGEWDLASVPLPESLKELELLRQYVGRNPEEEYKELGTKLKGLKNDERFAGLRIIGLEGRNKREHM